MKTYRQLTAWLLSISLISIMGCAPSQDPRIEKYRQQFLQLESPAVANSIQQIVDAAQLDASALQKITLVGRIHAGEMDPFDPEQASFAITEVPAPGHHHDDPGDCPFCKHKAENAQIAVVQFLDARGEKIKLPANTLFGLNKNQDIVVSGSATIVDDIFLVNASSISVLADVDAAYAVIAEDIQAEAEIVSEPDVSLEDLLSEPSL